MITLKFVGFPGFPLPRVQATDLSLARSAGATIQKQENKVCNAPVLWRVLISRSSSLSELSEDAVNFSLRKALAHPLQLPKNSETYGSVTAILAGLALSNSVSHLII